MLTKTTKTISYVTKPKPGGGFIAHPNDPSMETIEGATEEEIQQKVLATLATALDQKGFVGSLLKDLPVNVNADSRRTFILNSRIVTDRHLNPPASREVGNSTSDAPGSIRFERNKVFLPAILVIVAVAAILYIALR